MDQLRIELIVEQISYVDTKELEKYEQNFCKFLLSYFINKCRHLTIHSCTDIFISV